MIYNYTRKIFVYICKISILWKIEQKFDCCFDWILAARVSRKKRKGGQMKFILFARRYLSDEEAQADEEEKEDMVSVL